MTEKERNLLYGVVSLILPENILDQFVIVKLEDEDIARNDGTYQPFKHNVHIYLDEQDNRTADIYLRRSFQTDKPLKGRVVVKSCFDDAPCEIYLNGQLLVSYPDGDPDGSLSAQYLLTEDQTALIRTDGTENVLSMHVHNDFGGSNADLGLYIAEPPYTLYTTHNYGTQCGNILAADLDNDGTMEVLMAAEEGHKQSHPCWLLKRENGEWRDIGNPLNCTVRPSFSICDFDGDGTMVEEAGNRGTATTAVFALTDGSYTIGVQAVDGRRQGSAFCTRQFTMTYCHPFTWQARNRTAKLLPKRTDSLETNSQRKQANYCQSPKKNSILN